jgi:glycosyltransferase involved in cell wall biosynthesis
MRFFLTICARNYLAYATTLGRSLRQHHPDQTLVVWLIDGLPANAALPELRLRDIAEILAPSELAHLRASYNLRELATSVKPACMAALFAEGGREVVYLDPDIQVFAPLDGVLAPLAAGADGLLTPHVLHPLPRDGRLPNDHELLMAGVFNLGFLALAAGKPARELIEWWGGWLRTHCFEDKGTGTFTDQKWLNFAPAFWQGIQVSRDLTVNVAYWNLSERELALVDGRWLVNGQPLTFFHFSGFDPNDPGKLSKHQDRIAVAPGTPLARLLQQYAERLFAHGHREWRGVEPAPVAFENGVPWDNLCRSLYRQSLDLGLSFPEPLATVEGSFYAWLREPVNAVVEGRRPVTRYLHAAYLRRPDLVRAFPDLFGADHDAFQAWLAAGEHEHLGVNPALCEVPEAPPKAEKRDWSAVNYVGYLSSELGLGEAARGNVRALDQIGARVALYDVSLLSASDRGEWHAARMRPLTSPPPHDINIVHVNADQLWAMRERLGPSFFAGRYNIGFWAWEAPRFPAAWMDRLTLLDEIWVGGRFMYDAIAPVSPVPVVHIPHVVEVPPVRADKASFGLASDELVFLFMFDFFSTLSRKNPAGVLEAFRRAFHPDEPVRLVLKSMNGAKRRELFNAMRGQAADLRITVLDESLTSERRHALIASCDAFVSLHRAEGFGLGIAEAMAHGKPVVATGWSGNTDFANLTNSYPVGYSLRTLEVDDPPYEAGTVWAEPDLDHAAALMRSIWKDPEAARRIGARASEDIRKHHSPARVGRLMLDRLAVLAKFDRERMERVAEPPAPAPEPEAAPQPPGEVTAGRAALRQTWRSMRHVAPASWDRQLVRAAEAMKRRLGYPD